jgi:hypothetical protein
MPEFRDIKEGFEKVFSDKQWPWKVLLGGFLLINPFLLALAPTYFAGLGDPTLQVAWVHEIFPFILGFNVLSFWFPLGFTYEVLRRARSGQSRQLPDWSLRVLPRYAYEGSVKLIISIFTLIIPVGIWMGFCTLIFCLGLGLPTAMLSLFLPVIMLFVIPFCGVACCRWLDGSSIMNCALNYGANWVIFRSRWKDFLLASFILTGINTVTTGLFYTIPFAAVFGLCLVDTWFGPIYADAVKEEVPSVSTGREARPEADSTSPSEALSS